MAFIEEVTLNALSDVNTSQNNDSTSERSYSASCRVVLYHYIDPNPKDHADLATTMFVERANFSSMHVHNPVLAFDYTKTNNAAAGYFRLVFAPTENWLKQIAPGDWICVYLDNGRQGEQLRCVGNVDTVTMSETIDPSTGARSVKYLICGQDFGKVLESYWILMHPFLKDAAIAQLMIPTMLDKITGGPSEVITVLLEAFLSAKSTRIKGFKLPAYLQQWLIPSQMAQDLTGHSVNATANNQAASRFYDLLDTSKIHSHLPGNLAIYLLNVNNSLWGIMKQHSNPYLNELFCEMTDEGVPAVFLRTIPFTFKDFAADPLVADSLTRFMDLGSARVTGGEILGSQISKTDQARFNFTLLLSTQPDFRHENPLNSISLLSGKFPNINAASCYRYGLRAYEGVTEYGLGKDLNDPNVNILLAWNELIQHWLRQDPFVESINLQMMGNRDIRVGKRLDIVDGPLLEGFVGTTRSFYIESYMDSWQYPGSWTQQVTGTRGVFIQNGHEVLTHEITSNLHSVSSASQSARDPSTQWTAGRI